MGKKTTHLKRAAMLMVRFANKGAIYTNQQRDILLTLFLAFFIAIVPFAAIYQYRTTESERENLIKARAEMRQMIIEEIAHQQDSVNFTTK